MLAKYRHRAALATAAAALTLVGGLGTGVAGAAAAPAAVTGQADAQSAKPMDVSMGGGTVLTRGDDVSSAKATLMMQSDGNLVVYDEFGNVRWSSGTQGLGDYAYFQTDGNLVIYDEYNYAVWSSGTDGYDNANLNVQEDGNVTIWWRGYVVWQTYTGH